MKSSQQKKKTIKLDTFPVRCLKDTSWKVATDEIAYLLQSHLQFLGMNFLWVLIDIILNQTESSVLIKLL